MTEVDVAILGGGSAGCVLAARLSEDPRLRVLLVEAGDDLREGAVPATISSPYPGKAYFDPGLTWPGLRARFGATGSNAPRTTRSYEQARILGGGSAINGIGANRGSPEDYDGWAAMGATGWGWADVLPYFRKLETDLDYGATAWHGDDGPIPIQRIRCADQTGFTRVIAAELERRGWPMHHDQNGAWADGVFPVTVNLDGAGRRASVATAYLTPAVRSRPNLTVHTGTVVDRVVVQNGRARTVVLRRGAAVSEVHAHHFVVSSGALHSPAILMRSGVGPGAMLQALGIQVTAELPGVGRNLQEHPSTGVSGFLRAPGRLPRGEHYHIQAMLRWSSGLDGTQPGDMHLAINSRSGWHQVGWRVATLFGWVNQAYSTGNVMLASADPAVPPTVDFRLLSDERDLLRLAQSFRLSAAVTMSDGVRPLIPAAFASAYSTRVKRLLKPGLANGVAMAVASLAMDRSSRLRRRILAIAGEGTPSIETLCADESALHSYLKRTVGGTYHPCGSCRIGPPGERITVCDPGGNIVGICGLSVCDASLFPTVPCANLNIPVIMAAEKLSDSLKTQLRNEGRPVP